MEDYQIILLVVAGMALLYSYGYMLVRAYSSAYFKSKLEYQHNFFTEMNKDSQKDGVA